MNRGNRGNVIRRAAKKFLRLMGYDVVPHVPDNMPTFDEKRRADFMLSLGIDLLLDVGANTGQDALSARRGGYLGRILSFEPIDAVFTQLKESAAKDSQWECLPVGLSDSASRGVINVAANNGESSSILPMDPRCVEAAPEAHYLRQEEITLTRLDEVRHEYLTGARKIWLKIDVQGYERFVLEGAGDVLARAAAVEMELTVVDLYDGQDLIEQSIADLRRRAFHLVAIEEAFVDPSTHYALQFSGIFVREPRVLATGRQLSRCEGAASI